MPYIYGDAWNEKIRFMIEHITEEQARARFTNGPWFSVAKGQHLLTDYDEALGKETTAEVPEYSLDITPGAEHIRANFYTHGGSLGANYDWRQENGKMFLCDVSVWEYPDEDTYYIHGQALIYTSISFTTDGFSKEYLDDKSKTMIDLTDRCEVPLDAHWENIPTFGHWEPFGILRRKQPQT
ncbi:MAG: hypothetical protein ACRC0L_11335 [Angustibacter sp.]